MKSLRLDRWASQLQPPRNPRLYLFVHRCSFSTHDSSYRPRKELHQRQCQLQSQWQPQRRTITRKRRASTAAAPEVQDDFPPPDAIAESESDGLHPNFPLHSQATRSAKLSALRARLSLPAKFPVQTLARCLIDPSVDPRSGYNNSPFSILGQELLGYYTAEYLMCKYPRLPISILFAAQYAYVGPATLAALRSEWGVEVVAAPGPEVDPGLLQLKRITPGNAMAEDGTRRLKDMPQARRLGTGRKNEEHNYRRGMSSRTVYDDEFGDLRTGVPEDNAPYAGAPISESTAPAEDEKSETLETSQEAPLAAENTINMDTEPVTVEQASAGFVRALAGALYLHAGTSAIKDFHRAHILSRHLQLHTLFDFTHPTRDLSRLCAKEGLEPPVARLITETGRLSRSPVFVVGVFSGNDKLGEGAGSSLNEGRVRAAAAALRSWYLYSPPDTEIVFPSDVEGAAASKKIWKPQMIDSGEIIT